VTRPWGSGRRGLKRFSQARRLERKRGAAVEAEVVLGLEVGLALAVDFGFRAQGGRSDWSWPKAIPATRRAETNTSKGDLRRRGVIDIGS